MFIWYESGNAIRLNTPSSQTKHAACSGLIKRRQTNKQSLIKLTNNAKTCQNWPSDIPTTDGNWVWKTCPADPAPHLDHTRSRHARTRTEDRRRHSEKTFYIVWWTWTCTQDPKTPANLLGTLSFPSSDGHMTFTVVRWCWQTSTRLSTVTSALPNSFAVCE